ncbi:Decaprenyl-diphosphate synthase subunit 1 [Portunus trituberculatus]|uniref:Decaprenyl-diphosphate synthase subunit 1 n=1 Tax=Portunus trituberculatus TaxID=210409 RepID=A0A5B7FTI2_PORTR|nr:Decaprenyl-diphosphate synthase subunit 1 [Portunus trituberculatus]
MTSRILKRFSPVANAETLLLDSQRDVAMAAEMIHTASLVHDDVLDVSDTRRGKASINSIHGQRKVSVAGGAGILAVLGETRTAPLGSRWAWKFPETLNRVRSAVFPLAEPRPHRFSLFYLAFSCKSLGSRFAKFSVSCSLSLCRSCIVVLS